MRAGHGRDLEEIMGDINLSLMRRASPKMKNMCPGDVLTHSIPYGALLGSIRVRDAVRTSEGSN